MIKIIRKTFKYSLLKDTIWIGIPVKRKEMALYVILKRIFSIKL